MKIKEGKSALEQNLYRSFLLLSATLVLISLGFTLFFDISRQRKDMDKLISGTASYIAAIPDVAAMLENGYPDSTVTRDLDSLSLNIPDINVILISDKNGLRFYHTNRLKTGDSYVAGDEDAILAGSDPYITTGYGTHGMQRRAFHAVKNSDGEIVGFVMVSLFTATLSAQHRSLLFFYIIIFLIMMIVSISLIGTVVISKIIGCMLPLLAKRRTMRQPPITNGSPLTIGSRGIVLREIPQGDIGRVRVDGLDWQARTVDGTPLPKDARCEVKNVDGAVLIVSAVPVPAAAQPAEQLH